MVKSGVLEDVYRHLPIKGDVSFLKGKKFSEKVKKQQLVALQHLVEDLKYHLEPGEEILFAARAVSPFSTLEQITTGWSIFYLKRCVLVLTDRRLLHFPTRYSYKPRNSVAQVRFADVAGVRGGSKLTLTYKDGSREAFYYVRNGKRLRRLLEPMITTGTHISAAPGRYHLCPRCAGTLLKDRWECPRCRLAFKNRRTARLYSVFLPGGGYFYTRHPWLGIGDTAMELVLMALTFVFLAGPFLRPERFGRDHLVIGGIFGLVLVFEKWVTLYHAGHFIKEYIPVEKSFTRQPKAPPPPRVKTDDPLIDLEDERVTFS